MREKFRVWAESLETFFLEVIFEERHDFRAKLTRGFLFGGSKIFQVAVKLRRWLYNVRIFRDKTLGVQVIAIGNLTVNLLEVIRVGIFPRVGPVSLEINSLHGAVG